MKIKIIISLKQNILDPQGETIKNALTQMAFENITSVRQGKIIELELTLSTRDEAMKYAEDMAEKLLVNPTMERYQILLD